ncbi:MAG TPA: VIT1/CCC1 transporter family protein [Candidatus Saccharimonadales bacterium]|nr:VIT1/CCC1 transporter family protein [Candidatus Saccharimonadales bacterium]
MEHEPHAKTNNLANIILGGQDGLVAILGLILGLVASTHSIRIILAGGLAATFAESISMGAVAYTSNMADRDHYAAERKREMEEVVKYPEQERSEVEEIFKSKGFGGKLLTEIVDHITSDKKLWVDTMMREELNLQLISKKDVYKAAYVVGLSTLAGSILPLIPFFFMHNANNALVVALAISVLTLAAVGIYKAKTTLGNPAKAAIEMVVIGMGAALAGYIIGQFFKQ